MLIVAVAPLLAAVAPGFAPPLDRPVSYLFSDVREDRGRVLRFDVRRTITFRSDPDGLLAEVETIAVDEAADRAGAMFAAMMRGIVGRRIVFRLDPAGRVIDVTDLDAQWNAYVDAIGRALGKADAGTPKAATVAQIVAAHRATPRKARVATLAEMLVPVIGDATSGVRAVHEITLPGRSHDGTAVSLSGTERTVAADNGTLRLERSARGTVNGLATALTLARQVDPSSGLVRESVERLVTETPSGAATITRTVTKIG